MKIDIITTGAELLLGITLNRHHHWLSRQLLELGLAVDRHIAVTDAPESIENALRDAFRSSDLVITTGGLGPTSDDRTRSCVAHLLNRPLREDPSVVRHIAEMFGRRGRSAPERTRVQALVPEGALVLPNETGTAPGLVLELSPNPYRSEGAASWLIMLPGPPRELQPMFLKSVVPWLKERFTSLPPFVSQTVRTTGMGESLVEERLENELTELVERGLEVGYCARVGEVDVRLSARGSSAAELVRQGETVVRRVLGGSVFGAAEEDLELAVVRLLARRRETLATAESCTGGSLAHRLTNVPGSSEVFTTGYIAYSNEAKQRLLAVPFEALEREGAVSEATALAMAEGAQRFSGATYALAVTGIAGPGGGTESKPVGTVWIALASPTRVAACRRFNPFDRLTFKEVTTQQALDWLRRSLISAPKNKPAEPSSAG